MFQKKFSAESSPCFNLVSASLLFLLFLSHFVFIWGDFHFFTIDQWGHIASSVLFSEGYFHEYVDRFYFGYVQNLFYPPLQDALLASLNSLTRFQLVASYKAYMCLVLSLYLFSFWRLSLEVKNLYLRAGLLISLLAFLFIQKNGLTELQGLGLTDFLMTGLNNQILGMSFFLLMVAHLKRHCHIGYVSLLCSLCILSHLIVGLVAGLLLFIYFLTARRHKRRIFLSGLLTLGLTSFFWLPFFWYRDQLIPSNFYQLAPWTFIIVSSFVLWLRPRAFVRSLAILAVFLSAPEIYNFVVHFIELESILPFSPILPAFHYSRLPAFALILTLIALFYSLDRLAFKMDFSKPRSKWKLAAFGFLPILLLLVQVRLTNTYDYFKNVDADQKSYKTLKSLANDLEVRDHNRIWVWHLGRPIDNLMGSVMASHNKDLQFLKGLFWESSPNNGFITNYIVSLDGLPSVVDYSYFTTQNCEIYNCLFDSAIQELGVTHIIAPKSIALLWKSRVYRPRIKTNSKFQCMQELFRDKSTKSFRLSPVRDLEFLGQSYSLYEIQPNQSSLQPSNVDVISLKRLKQPRSHPGQLFLAQLAEVCQDQSTIQYVYTSEENIWMIENLGIDPNTTATVSSYERTKMGSYDLTVDSSEPQLLHFKTAYHPGLKLRDSNQRELPFFESYPGSIGVGNGELNLRFERTSIFYLAYAISIFTALLFVFGYFFQNRWKAALGVEPE